MLDISLPLAIERSRAIDGRSGTVDQIPDAETAWLVYPADHEQWRAVRASDER